MNQHKALAGLTDLGKAAGRTAISRSGPSAPAKQILSELKGKHVIDWGSGRGADAAFYEKSGVKKVEKYDPNHHPIKPTSTADIVTNTFVANVLPPMAREEMLREAMSHAREKLIVSVRSDKIPGIKHQDGVITSTGTFQKSYGKGELVKELQRVFPDAKVTALKSVSGGSIASVQPRVPAGNPDGGQWIKK